MFDINKVDRNIENLAKDIKEELIEDFIEENSYLDFVVKELELLKNT